MTTATDIEKVKTTNTSPEKKDMDIKEGEVILQNGDIADFQYQLAPEDDARLARKIDFCLIPIMTVTYCLQFIDKNTLVDAAVLGLTDDLHVTGSDYSWAGSIFYIGYLIACYPLAFLMVKLPLGKVLAATMVGWAAVLLCTAALQNTAGLLAVRFFLGATESAISPGFNMVTAMWYKRSEQTSRIGVWFLGNSIGGFLGSLIFYGIGHLKSFPSWRAGFLIVGSINMVWGLSMIYLFPDTPMTAWFLNKEDRKKSISRVQENKTGIKNNKFKVDQAIDSIKDPLCLLIFLLQVTAAIPNGGITNFSSLIIKGIGFSQLHTILLKMASYGFQVIFIGMGIVGCKYMKNARILWICIFNIICIAGGLMVRLLPTEKLWPRFFGVCLMMSFAAGVPMKMSLISSNVGGFTRKATVNAVMFRASEAPKYPTGFIGMVGCWAAVFVEALVLLLYLKRENRRRDKLQAQGGESPPHTQEDIDNFSDKTDRENLSFRYVY
ncbi:major facilitator superfamily transporter [Fusarium albosuccineum]|uniref:Major facilitator superfamily transporter n=1 Tax=Fusarium albosuccineum TaxID=1237068 RepID=A0A8H4L656_9HYPO|nr:major facilitator superfamily transporter [Fusarium albosuccineum]